MKVKSDQLISELIELTKKNLNAAEKLNMKSEGQLNRKEYPNSWSALECLEHLNRYGDYYMVEIAKQIRGYSKPRTSSDNSIFKSGWLGNYFAKIMAPKDKLNKMKTFKNMNPSGSLLQKAIIDKFIEQQKTTLELLNQARSVNLTKVKTGVTISSIIRLRLGDTFRVVINHNERHLVQAQKAIENSKH